MTSAEAFPLHWPVGWKRTPYRTKSNFDRNLTFGRARDELFAELRRLGATGIVLSTNIELRQDGLPYSNRRIPADPGVSVYFQYKKRPMVFACDQWRSPEENVRAICKTIEAIRGIERWGASDMLERAFSGFQALPQPETKKHWTEVLSLKSTASVEQITERMRELALKNHPDRGGDTHKMADINNAYQEAMDARRP